MIFSKENTLSDALIHRADELGKITSLSMDESVAQNCVVGHRTASSVVIDRFRTLAKQVSHSRYINHEVESILDNFFIIETTVFDINTAFKKRDFKKFPLITKAKGERFLRLYSVLREFVQDTKGRVEKTDLLTFINTYQQWSPFSIRELNAVPVMLKLILVEDFGELVSNACSVIDEYKKAEDDYVAITKASKRSSWDPSKITLSLAKKYGTVPINFGLHLIGRLNQDGSKMRPIIKWIRLNLEKQGFATDSLSWVEEGVRTEQTTLISNITESLHWLNQVRWDAVAEKVNIVDGVLSGDPSGVFSSLNLETKNEYRNVVVRLAEQVSIHEAEIARVAVQLASHNKQSNDPLSSVKRHVGYYLVDVAGRQMLEREVHYRPTNSERLYRLILNHPSRSYFGLLLSISLGLSAGTLSLLGFPTQMSLVWVVWVLATFLINLEIAIHVSNILVTRVLPVRKLPRLNLEHDLGENHRTFVVVPSMLRSEKSIRDLVSKLETRYVGNQQQGLYYALLLDFPEAHSETLDTDASLIQITKEAIASLNAKYAQGLEKRFFALIRKRIWNESEQVFMAWERKRGKLREFNELMRGKDTTYIITDDVESLSRIRYVITLDEDTELPHDAARRLVGAIAHPLNAPVINTNGKVIRGYGIIQPRVSVRLSTATRSVFSRLYSVVSGIDSYSGPVSDVYQDLFDNALFFGKGVYDIDAVESSMKGKIPDNTVLSHDLLEGLYTRVGFASDIVLFDGFPKFYHEFIVRHERWVRGDWQIIGWLSGKFRQGKYGVPVERLAFVDRFKIFDNLRRSLVPVAALCSLAIGYLTDISLEVTTGFIVLALIAPYALPFIVSMAHKGSAPFRLRIRKWVDDVFVLVIHSALRIFFLLEQALVSVIAITKTLWRLYVTRKKLLQWKISEDVGAKLVGRFYEYYKVMRLSVLLAITTFVVVLIRDGNGVMVAWSLVWLVAPFIAYSISIQTDIKAKLGKQGISFVRGMAYRNALFFLDNAKRETNWLIPDHVQERPRVIGEDRKMTSPTNMGMHISSLIAAHELGYLSTNRYADRIDSMFKSLSRLERCKGHFLNWYDVEKLEAIQPKYVSSVDSANLLLAFIAAEQSYLRMGSKPLVSHEMGRGVADALREFSRDISMFKNVVPKTVAKDVVSLQKVLKDILKETATLSQLMPQDYVNKLTILHKRMSRIVHITKEIVANDPGPALVFHLSSAQSAMSVIEDQMLSLQSLLPYIHHSDHSAALYATHDSAVLNLVHLIEKEAVSGFTLDLIADSIPTSIARLSFLETLDVSSLSRESKRFLAEWYRRIVSDVDSGAENARRIRNVFARVARESNAYVKEADFGFLYNKEKELFHIGFNASFNRMDAACYNFMASESNAVSFVAILKNQAPQKHWFYLSRKLVRSGGDVSLVSWGGSLFEYLTSLIFFSTHKESLLGATARAAINVHRKHARKHRMLWGMGESAYASFDNAKRYQYQVFGSNEIGLKRNLGDFLVVAPYVSALALPIVPKLAYRNLCRFVNNKMCGKYGFFDALDYSDGQGGRAKQPVPVEIYYAHHQGFALCSMYNSIANNSMHRLFHLNPAVRSLDTLFEERMPDTPAAETLSFPVSLTPSQLSPVRDTGMESKRLIIVKSAFPQYSFIANRDCAVRISEQGSCTSSYRGIALTRPKADAHSGSEGTSMYIRTHNSSEFFSVLPHSSLSDSRRRVTFQENKVEFFEDHKQFETSLSISVDDKAPVIIRELYVTNKSQETLSFDVVTYGEVSLAYENQELHHPHYQHILVESEDNQAGTGVIFSRPHPQDRSKKIYFTHYLAQSSFSRRKVSFTCARNDAFSQYGVFNPFLVFDANRKPNPKVPLDPAFVVGAKISLKPGEHSHLFFVEIVSESRNELEKLLQKYASPRLARRISSRAIEHSVRLTGDLGVSQDTAVVFQNIASIVISGIRKSFESSVHGVKPVVHSLWNLGVSGDHPIALFIVYDIGDIPTVRQIIQCFSYWKTKGIEIDVVILNNQPTSYMKVFDDEIDFLVRQAKQNSAGWTKSTLYQVKGDLASEEDKKVLIGSARFVVDIKKGTLTDAVRLCCKNMPGAEAGKRLKLKSKTVNASHAEVEVIEVQKNLDHHNSWGGFDRVTGQYVMSVSSHNMPPKPWNHIIANEHYGAILGISGATYSWSEDSYDNRMTSFSNDSLQYTSGETVYIRDRACGTAWNPTPFPIKTGAPFSVIYGFGYAEYCSEYNGVKSKFTTFIPENASVKISLLELSNTTKERQDLTIFSHSVPVMGMLRSHLVDHIQFDFDEYARALFFRNGFRNQFEGSVGFVSFGDAPGVISYTTDTKEFFGNHGSYENPIAMRLASLSNSTKSHGDSSIVLALEVHLEPGESKTIPVIIGEAKNRSEAERIATHWSTPHVSIAALDPVINSWKKKLGAVKVSTGDTSVDYLMNGWLLYQAQTSRILAKTGYYQPSGAYGFRDQLQDSLSLLWSNPQFVKSFIMKACSKQFVEGDPLTWWHEHNMFGLRTVLSDHQLWLAYVAGEYVRHTGDTGIFDIQAPFLSGPTLDFSGHGEWAGIPHVASEGASVYEHIMRAIEKSLVFGEHDLPLIGYSDWNDGLSSVGRNGKGESVWSAWFILSIIDSILPYVIARGDTDRATSLRSAQKTIEKGLEQFAWDGRWYRRAFFDNGTPLGSRKLKEFRIDSIAQSWSVISRCGDKEHTLTAQKSMVKHLLKKDYFALIDPALSSGAVRPGYIQDYPPGIRENGAQYNHAALWAIQSLAIIGDIENASKILDLVNPIKRSEGREKAQWYGVEPYVVASDIYGGERAGQGGWTWYTGSAGVMYRTVIDNLFGVTRRGNIIELSPHLPLSWNNPKITILCGSSVYDIIFQTDKGRTTIEHCELDGVAIDYLSIPFVDDGCKHIIKAALI